MMHYLAALVLMVFFNLNVTVIITKLRTQNSGDAR